MVLKKMIECKTTVANKYKWDEISQCINYVVYCISVYGRNSTV